jgi:hypothetical protein
LLSIDSKWVVFEIRAKFFKTLRRRQIKLYCPYWSLAFDACFKDAG